MNADGRRLELMEPTLDPADARGVLNRISERVIGCAFEVSNTLGCGFLEKVYENALSHELRASGLTVVQQAPLTIRYKKAVVGEYVADILVEDRVVIETKACKALDDVHVAQCLNYLKATGFHLALLINFGLPRIDVRRLVNKF